MSQDWTDDSYASGHVGDTDLTNMEKNFLALKSLFSGAAQPASMAACHPWFDTTKHVLKVRNDGDSAWVGLMHGDASQKIWVYRNAAMDGWAIDSGVTDVVLALKGGSTYTTGAATAGTWTQPSHTLTVNEMPSGLLDLKIRYQGEGVAHNTSGTVAGGYDSTPDTTTSAPFDNTPGGAAHNHGSAYRPAAAVGTLQYLDL